MTKDQVFEFIKILKLYYNRIMSRAIPGHRLFLLKMMPKNSICAEIGVWKGEFSSKILEIVGPKELNLIDPWKFEKGKVYKNAKYGGKSNSQKVLDEVYNSVLKKFNSEIHYGQVKIYRKSSEMAVDDFPDEYFDWIYIDGNHLYEFVKKDLELYTKKVRKGGYITGDDYTGEGSWWNNDVKKAVDEFLEKGIVKKIKVRYGQFVLKRL